MNLICKLISEELTHAVGWTIVHSLWQGIVVALVFGLVMLFMRRCSSRTRYYIGVMALMLILTISVVTFVTIYHPGNSVKAVGIQKDSSVPVITDTAVTSEISDPIVKQPDRDFTFTVTSIFKSDLNRYIPLLATVWFLGVLLLVLKLAGGLLYNQRLKVHQTRLISASWQHRLEKLCQRTKVRQPVRLLESALVKVPITIGYLKPIILLPVGLVSGLPGDQVEALLTHELAHILRKDYLVNIVQNFINILYFYHPGVRWISANVRWEREKCCDDIAVTISGDSLNVAEALTNIQVYSLKRTAPAMAFARKTPRLLERIKRLIHPPKIASRFAERFIGACILVVFLLALVLNTNAAAGINKNMTTDQLISDKNNYSTSEDEPKSKKRAELIQVIKRELKKDKLIDNGIYFEIKLTNKGLFINGIQQTAALSKKYKDLYENLGGKILEKEISFPVFNISEAFQRQIDESEEIMKIEKEHKENLIKLKEKYKEKERTLREMLKNLDEEMKKDEERLKMRMTENVESKKKYLRRQEIIKKELLKDKLIDDENNYKLKLTSGSLYINEVKQATTFFKKYKKLLETLYEKKIKSTFRIIVAD